MEMTYTESLSGVNNEPAAAEQENPVVENDAVEETTTETPDTGENEGEITDDPAAGDETKVDEKVETAFAKRLAAEREKIQREVRDQAQRELLAQLKPALDLLEEEARPHGLNALEYARARQANREAEMEQQYWNDLQEQADELGVDPRLLHQVALKHPALQKVPFLEQKLSEVEGQLNQKLAFERQFKELDEAYPGLDLRTITPEVFQVRDEEGISLKAAYEKVSGRTETDTLREENARLKAALEAKKKNEENAASSPGSVNGQGAPPAEYISRETFEQNKDDRGWVMKNLSLLSKSRAKW